LYRNSATLIFPGSRQRDFALSFIAEGISMTGHHAEAVHDGHAPILERVQALRSQVEAEADRNEEATEISAGVLDAIDQAGVFKIMAPGVLGGTEAHPLLVIDVLRALSYFDGSTGWYCQAATTGVAVAGAFLGDRAVDEIFCSGRTATCAGQAAPSGKAERAGDGYRISGSFSFGSGLPNASWVVGGYILHKDGTPVLRDSGEPVMLIAMAPRARVELRGNWNVLGLRGTGSYDFHVPEQIVHADFAFDAGQPEQKRGGALYKMGFTAIPALCHASFGVGCARRALDEWALYAQGKKRMTGGTIAEMETFQKDFAVAHARLRSAETYVRSSFDALFRGAGEGTLADDLKLDGRLSACNAIAVGVDVSQQAFTSSATTGLRNGSRIQRCFRDMQAANAHFLTAEQSFIASGRFLAGIPGAAPGL
jgi:alkylation response protein AidB-like acyl-CoA dehydrogenase